MAPGSIHNIFTKPSIFSTIYLFLFYFANYNYLQLSTHLTRLQITRIRRLATLWPALGASCLFFCVQPLKTVVVDITIGSINLGFITEGNTYPHCTMISHSSSRKTQRRSEVSSIHISPKSKMQLIHIPNLSKRGLLLLENIKKIPK